MGFYIRKGFNFGPLRLNLSRSGLGASFGVKGARIGVGPRGSYIHLGRGGFYYRQSLGSCSPSRPSLNSTTPPQPLSDGLQEISSADATAIVDASATGLLQELNRVKRQHDFFPVVLIVGSVLLLKIIASGVDWWAGLTSFITIAALAVLAKHYDVTNNTTVLNYSLGQETEAEFSKLQSAFRSLGSCQGFWHLDASGDTSDWKRNAGASSLVQKTGAQLLFTVPPKMVSNLNVPTLKSKRKSLYFFPDRLLVYDSSGVGAVNYSEVQATMAQTRFVEGGAVPSDATQVGTTWRFVNRSGGPDRRFNNNRELPILLYGELYLTSNSGLNEAFQCSTREAPTQVASEILAFAKSLASAVPTDSQSINDVSFDSPGRDNSPLFRMALWGAVVLMGVITLIPASNSGSSIESLQEAQARIQLQQTAAREQFAKLLSQSRPATRQTKVSVSVVNDRLAFKFTGEGPKAAHRDGLAPFKKQTFFKKFLEPHTESELCGMGFRALEISSNGKSPGTQVLDCGVSPNP